MKKPKILKKLPKQNKNKKINTNFKATASNDNKFVNNYLNYYDDIKVNSKRYDW